MLQLYMIALVGLVVARDALPWGSDTVSWWKIAGALTPFVLIAVVVQGVCWACGRVLDRPGRLGGVHVMEAERMLLWSRPLTVIAHAVAVFGFGWVGQVRGVVGDWILIDELLAIMPAVLTMVAGWWSFYPIERRLREAVIFRTIESGHPVYAIPDRHRYVWSHVRHDLLLMLVPLAMVSAWGECVERGIAWLKAQSGTAEGISGRIGAWLSHGETGALVQAGAQLLGVAAVFAIAPLILRMVWDTVRLGEGPMRGALLAICERAGVRVREVLVWRTHGTLINGAAMGVIPAIRYILLTDALLDRLPEREVHAVMAHEVAHVKHRHIPWLIASMLAAAGIAGTALSAGLAGADRAMGIGHGPVDGGEIGWGMAAWVLGSEAGATVLSLVVMFAAFGWISRRFEWQADAFAARHLSAEAGSGVVTEEAARAMAGALASVARLNHIPMDRKSFRHGSIQTRIRKLDALVGRSVEKLRADVVARRIKWCAAAGVAMVVGLTVWEVMAGGGAGVGVGKIGATGAAREMGVSSHVSVGRDLKRLEQETRR